MSLSLATDNGFIQGGEMHEQLPYVIAKGIDITGIKNNENGGERFLLKIGESSLIISIEGLGGSNELNSVYFGDYNVSSFLNSHRKHDLADIVEFAEFFLNLQIETRRDSNSHPEFNVLKFLGTSIWGLSTGSLGLVGVAGGLYDGNSWLIGIGILMTTGGGFILKDAEKMQFLKFIETYYPTFFGKKSQQEIRYLTSGDPSILPDGVQKILLSLIKTRLSIGELLGDELENMQSLLKKISSRK